MGRLAEKLATKGAAFERAYLGSLASSQAMSGQFDKYCQTLTTFEFIEAKINHPNFGLSALLEDYALVEDPEVSTHPDYNPRQAQALQLIQEALLLSAHILTEDKTQLIPQLWGRLGDYFQIPEIKAMLEAAKQQQASPWLHPLTPSLTLPGGRLIRTFTGHTNSVNAVAITPDGKRIISVSDDNTLKIWDLSTGNIIASFTVESALTCCAVAPDGVTIVAGDELGRVHFLRLEGITQEELI